MKRFLRLLAPAFPGVGLAAARTATVKRKVQLRASPTPVPATVQTALATTSGPRGTDYYPNVNGVCIDGPVARTHEPRGIMCCLGISQSRSAGIHVVLSAVICWLLGIPTGAAWQQTYSSNIEARRLPQVKAVQTSTWPGHPPDTRTGQKVSSGMSGGQKAAIIAGILGAAITTAVVVHNYQHKQPSVDNLMEKGPQVPEKASMSHLMVDGLIGPGWPVAVDFQLDGPGSLSLDITTAEKVRYHQELTNDLHGRGITITHPDGLPDKLQPAIFDLEAVAPAGINGPPPTVRIYGMAAGPQAVGSIAIDKLAFGPSEVKMRQPAQYGFHSHSDFSNVCADFMFTGLKDNHIVMKQDSETTLNAVSRDEHAHGFIQTKGTVGQHLLQIRAWRGDSGDWVVAWSPDVVTLTK